MQDETTQQTTETTTESKPVETAQPPAKPPLPRQAETQETAPPEIAEEELIDEEEEQLDTNPADIRNTPQFKKASYQPELADGLRRFGSDPAIQELMLTLQSAVRSGKDQPGGITPARADAILNKMVLSLYRSQENREKITRQNQQREMVIDGDFYRSVVPDKYAAQRLDDKFDNEFAPAVKAKIRDPKMADRFLARIRNDELLKAGMIQIASGVLDTSVNVKWETALHVDRENMTEKDFVQKWQSLQKEHSQLGDEEYFRRRGTLRNIGRARGFI